MTSPIVTKDLKELTPRKEHTPRKTPTVGRPFLSAGSRGLPTLSPQRFVSAAHFNKSPHYYSRTNSPHMMQQSQKSQRSQQFDVIYGTTISMKKVTQVLQRFILQFTIASDSPTNHEQQPHQQKIYLTQLSDLDLQINQNPIFYVKATHIKQFDVSLYLQLIYFPAEMIMVFDQIIKKVYQQLYMNDELELDKEQLYKREQKKNSLMVGITHLGEVKIMRNIDQKQINRLISFRGIVVRTSEKIPEMKSALFKCMKCTQEVNVLLENAKVDQPTACKKCFGKNTYELMHNLSEFTDKQYIKFQQLPEYVPQSQTPHAINVIAYDYNVDCVRPGDRVEVVGIYRVQQQRVMKSRSQTISVYKTHLDLISWRLVDQDRLKSTSGGNIPIFNDNDKQLFIQMAKDQNIINNLVESFAPSIHGNTHIKKGILAQLFGGTKKQIPELGRARFRSDINICLVGDPSTAKSQLLKQVHNIAPRGVYTSGRGSSAVGLTAHVKRDPQTKQFILESGALVLSDLGICCIDEFDKMDDNNKIILLQGMQQQTISIAKAGIVCQLNCRSSIIAAANPVNSKYNPKKSVVQNINLPPALLSRFDLIYILLDQPKQSMDKQIGFHLLSMYESNDMQIERMKMRQKGIYSKDLLTKYITYAREYINPCLSQEASSRLVKAYTDMRKVGQSRKIVTATPRQLQSMIRLSEAFAKMKLSNEVKAQDVEQALELINIAMQQAATDPNTGLIDMDVIVTGKTSASRQKVLNIVQKIKQLIISNPKTYQKKTNLDTIFKSVQQKFLNQKKAQKYGYPQAQKIHQKQVIQALKIIQTQGIINIFGSSTDRYKLHFKVAKDMS